MSQENEPPQKEYPPTENEHQPPKEKGTKSATIIIVIVIVIAVLLPILVGVLYVFFFPPESNVIIDGFGVWGHYEIINPTVVQIEFGKVSPEPRPTKLEIVLIRNGTDEGVYAFPDDHDGQLTFSSGTYVGTLTYEDHADNQKVNVGDEITMTDLAPGSDYSILMIWGPTGDLIARKDFSTPT